MNANPQAEADTQIDERRLKPINNAFFGEAQ
jgi:hypothetical protein